MHLVPGTSQTLTPEWFGNVRSPTTVWILDILLWRLVFPLHCVDVEQAHIFTLGASTTSDSSTLRGIPRDRQVRIRNTPAAYNVMYMITNTMEKIVVLIQAVWCDLIISA